MWLKRRIQYAFIINNCLRLPFPSSTISPASIYARSRIYKSLCFSHSWSKFLWPKVGSVYYFLLLVASLARCVIEDERKGGRRWQRRSRALFCNRDKTKDVIVSIMLGFTAIFTILLLDVLLNSVDEILPNPGEKYCAEVVFFYKWNTW